jgi:hypothetical protein
VIIQVTFIGIYIYLRIKGLRHYSDALLGASVDHSPKKVPPSVVRSVLIYVIFSPVTN